MPHANGQEVLHQEWFQRFWARNYDALTVCSVLRNVQMDVDKTRKWVDAQLRHGTGADFHVRESCHALWQKNPRSEACLVDCLIEILFYDPADRSKYRKDALMQLVIEEPPGHLNFTVVSAMGVAMAYNLCEVFFLFFFFLVLALFCFILDALCSSLWFFEARVEKGCTVFISILRLRNSWNIRT